MCDTPRCGPSARLRSKIILSQKKGRSTYNLLYVLFFPNSFYTHVTNSVKFIDKLWYRKGCYVHYEREVMLEDVATPRERSETPMTSMPPGSRQILAVCSSLALGCTRGCWAVYAGVRL